MTDSYMENILEKINKSGLKLLETMTPEETYVAIVKEAMSLVEAEHGSIFLQQHDVLKRVYTSLPDLNKNIIRKNGYVLKTFKSRKPYVAGKDELAKVHPGLKVHNFSSTTFIPLSYHNESIGVLTLNSVKDEHFTQRELDVLTLFGSMASLAIKKSQQYAETKKALEIRDMFISMAAHELRTPLTSINGYIQLLHRKLKDKEGVEGKWIQELFEESKRMTTLVKELLEVNRLKTGQIQFMWQECGVVPILRESVQEMQRLYPDREIALEIKVKEAEDGIIGDASKLGKVFTNIIDNGLKYSPRNSKVMVGIAQKSGVIVVSIKDFGKGIDKNDIPNIFEGQHQGVGGEEGMGIGLFFVESVIRQHKGSISVKSKVNKGSTFEVRLPKSKL